MSLPPVKPTIDLRHTHATLALQAGIHPKVVSERLGHATISITLDTYSHAIPAMQEEAAALIAGLVFTRLARRNRRVPGVAPSTRSAFPAGHPFHGVRGLSCR